MEMVRQTTCEGGEATTADSKALCQPAWLPSWAGPVLYCLLLLPPHLHCMLYACSLLIPARSTTAGSKALGQPEKAAKQAQGHTPSRNDQVLYICNVLLPSIAHPLQHPLHQEGDSCGLPIHPRLDSCEVCTHWKGSDCALMLQRNLLVTDMPLGSPSPLPLPPEVCYSCQCCTTRAGINP